MTIRNTTNEAKISSPKSVMMQTKLSPPPMVADHFALFKQQEQGQQKQQLQQKQQQQEGLQYNSNGNRKRPAQATWSCPASAKSQRTVNPVCGIVDPIVAKVRSGSQRGDGKDPISLAVGDPTLTGSLPPCPAAVDAVIAALKERPHATASYTNALGTPQARLAVARYHTYDNLYTGPDQVIITNGCNGALELALGTLLDPNTAILIPQPGFPQYQVIAESNGAQVVNYRLLPDSNWECDLFHLRELVQKHHNIRAMVINNPSSPTGGVFSENHIKQLLEFARTYRIPIVADEVYGHMVFGSAKFFPMAEMAAREGFHVPIITVSGLSKQFLLPGWRIGWVVFNDNRSFALQDVEQGAKRLAQVSHGACHLAQSVIPTLLSPNTPGIKEWKEDIQSRLSHQANFLSNILSDCHGLQVIPAQGALYAIVKIDTLKLCVKDDIDFATRLMQEENVFVLPGSSFGVENVFRVIFCSPQAVLYRAARRIERFCRRHLHTEV